MADPTISYLPQRKITVKALLAMATFLSLGMVLLLAATAISWTLWVEYRAMRVKPCGPDFYWSMILNPNVFRVEKNDHEVIFYWMRVDDGDYYRTAISGLDAAMPAIVPLKITGLVNQVAEAVWQSGGDQSAMNVMGKWCISDLEALTGQHFGTDVEAWRVWIAAHPGSFVPHPDDAVRQARINYDLTLGTNETRRRWEQNELQVKASYNQYVVHFWSTVWMWWTGALACACGSFWAFLAAYRRYTKMKNPIGGQPET